MRTKLYLILSFFLPIVLTACKGGDEPIPEPPVEDRRTVLVYMAADNSLSNFASGDLNEMKEGWAQMNTLGMHLLVYVDTGSSPRLIELEKKGNDVIEKVVKEYEDRNSVGVTERRKYLPMCLKVPDIRREAMAWSIGRTVTDGYLIRCLLPVG